LRIAHRLPRLSGLISPFTSYLRLGGTGTVTSTGAHRFFAEEIA